MSAANAQMTFKPQRSIHHSAFLAPGAPKRQGRKLVQLYELRVSKKVSNPCPVIVPLATVAVL
jgi:hypothetical protein